MADVSTVRTKLCFAGLALLASLLGTTTWAQEKKQPTAQQERMKSCNAQANQKSLQGRERQSFVSECLKANGSGKKLSAQQERMKSCNAQASSKDLKAMNAKPS